MEKFKVGIQLYSLREEMAADTDATLKAVKEMGYDYVEFAGYHGHSADKLKGMLDKYGLTAISVHQVYEPFLENEQEMIEYLKTLGVKYSAIPSMSRDKYANGDIYDTVVKEITSVATALKNAGITMLYHNHDYEFVPHEGKLLIDHLYDSIPADIFQTEFDCCWIKYAGYDPSEYLRKYEGRSTVLHLKDFICTKKIEGPVYDLIDESGKIKKPIPRTETGFEFRPVGQGCQDFPTILKTAEEVGIEYIIVEQDNSPTCTPLEAAKQSREYLKSIGY